MLVSMCALWCWWECELITTFLKNLAIFGKGSIPKCVLWKCLYNKTGIKISMTVVFALLVRLGAS